MSDNNGTKKAVDPPRAAQLPSAVDDLIVSSAAFRESFGENIQQTLDVSTWRIGSDLTPVYARVEREVSEAVRRETLLHRRIREHVFPLLKTCPNAPKNAGVHKAQNELIKRIHENLLFRDGGVEACDGIMRVHETLPLTIYQMGVTLVSYQGEQGAWSQRLFRRDLHQGSRDPVEEAIAVLQQRSKRSGAQDALGELARKAMLTYAERAILLRESKALWLMGAGNPITYELLTGGGNLELMVAATNVIRAIVEERPKFAFVAKEPRDKMLLTIGEALGPMEFAIVKTIDADIQDWLHQRRFAVETQAGLSWDQEAISPVEWIPRFIERVASKIVVGLFRVTQAAPAQMFYAHVDHADLAAHVILADSVLQKHRGAPMLTDMARHVCNTVFGDSLDGIAANAYAAAGIPWRYFNGPAGR